MRYLVSFVNGYTTDQFTTIGDVGGVLLDRNPLNFPKDYFMRFISTECSSVELKIFVSLDLSIDSVEKYPEVEKYLKSSYAVTLVQRIGGSNALSQTASTNTVGAFYEICQIISGLWKAENFKVKKTDVPNKAAVELSVVVSDESQLGEEAIDRLIKLLGYAPSPLAAELT